MTKYPLSYDIEHHENGISKDELREKGLGGADAVVLISLIFPKDGSRSQDTVSLDGRTGKPLDPIEMWKSWACLTNQLCYVDGLHDWQKEMCVQINEVITDIMTGKFQGGSDAQDSPN